MSKKLIIKTPITNASEDYLLNLPNKDSGEFIIATTSDVDTAVSNEATARQTAINDAVGAEATTRQEAIQVEVTARQEADSAINAKIPTQASASNQLADKDFVNSSISTNTANFLGTYNVVTDLGLTIDATHSEVAAKLVTLSLTPTNNDYSFVSYPDTTISTQFTKFERYKYDGSDWAFEYELNNSSFTADQWASINSGITDTLVTQIGTNQTNISNLQTNKVDKVAGSSLVPDTKVSSYDAHLINTDNPHSVTKAQVGLGDVVNTGDSATPVNGGTDKFTTGGAYTELNKKVDKKTTSGDFVYTHSTNIQGELAYTTAATASTIVERTTNGNIILPAKENITDSTYAVSKDYVDTYAGKIDTVSLHNIPLTVDINKNVDIPVYLTTTAGSEAITVNSDTLNVVTTDTTQTITGVKTFNDGIIFNDLNSGSYFKIYQNSEGPELRIDSCNDGANPLIEIYPARVWSYDYDNHLRVLTDAVILKEGTILEDTDSGLNIINSSVSITEGVLNAGGVYTSSLRVDGHINSNDSNHGLVLPSTDLYEDDKTVATTDDIPAVSLTTTAGSEAITVNSDTLNVVTKDTVQEISGTKTFNNLRVSKLRSYWGASSSDSGMILASPAAGELDAKVYVNFIPASGYNNLTLGSGTDKWKDLYLSRYLSDGTNSTTIANINNNFAPIYSSSSTYAVGDKVIYQGVLYKCSTAIETAEAWTAAHWTTISIDSLDSEVVHLAGDETIGGNKTFSGDCTFNGDYVTVHGNIVGDYDHDYLLLANNDNHDSSLKLVESGAVVSGRLLNPENEERGLVIPNTYEWTTDQTIATQEYVDDAISNTYSYDTTTGVLTINLN